MKTIVDYADLVKEQHALNTTIAPVETDLTSASQAYAVGQKFVYDGVLYQAKTAIAQGAALVLNTNYEAADDVSTEIEALTNQVNGNWSEGGKNLLPNTAITKTVSGVTFTKNSDGTITANGTATANIYFIIGTVSNLIGSFVLNGCPTGGGGSTYRLYTYVSGGGSTIASDYGAGASFTLAESTDIDVGILLLNGKTVSNLVFKPMIRPANIEDDTYVPYAMTNRELTELTNNYAKVITVASSVSGRFNLITNVFNQVVPLLPNVGDIFVGVVHWTGTQTFNCIASHPSFGEYKLLLTSGYFMLTGSRDVNEVITAYSYSGTQET